MKFIFYFLLITTIMQANYIRYDLMDIIVDKSNNIMWQDDTEVINNASTWNNAIKYCENSNFANYNDWRLSNLNELLSISSKTQILPFENISNDNYWSSTTDASDSSKAWSINFNTDTDDTISKISTANVRCVRNIQESDDFDTLVSILTQENINTARFNLNSKNNLINVNTKIDLLVKDNEKIISDITATDYIYTPLTGTSIENGYFSLQSGSYFTNIAGLFKYGSLKLLEEFEVISMDISSPSSVTETSYASSPFKLELATTYKDELSDANSFESQTRWFSFNVEKDDIYKLVYSLNTNESINIYPADPSNIIYNLYSKDSSGNIVKIGSKPFNPTQRFILDLALKKDAQYFLEFRTNDDLWTIKYIIALLENTQAENNEILYQELVTVDENAYFSKDIILPKFDTYDISIISDKEFDLDFDGKIVKNVDEYNLSKTYKEGKYSLKLQAQKDQKIFYTIKPSINKLELEDNDNYKHANIFNATTAASINNEDVDMIAFIQDDTDLTISFTLSNQLLDAEIFKVSILNAAGGVIASTTEFVTTSSFNVDFSVYDIKPNNYYIVKVLRNSTNTDPVEYTININSNKRVLTKTEEAYTSLYSSQRAGTILDENLNIITADVQDIGNLIILTGDSDNPTDALYIASQKLSSTFYNRFTQRGLSDDDIYWLNYNSIVDIDNDGTNDDVVDNSDFGKAKFYETITTWAKDTSKNGPLYIYMVDHGANGSFLLSSKDKDNDGKKEVIYANELVNAIDSFVDATSRDVYLIIEACKSGSFIPAVQSSTHSDKIAIITSSEAGKFSYIDKFGTVSFTKFMVDEILSGKTINKAYTDALTKLNSLGGVYKKQVALIYANTDALKNNIVGGSFGIAGISLTSIDNLYIDGVENNTNIDVESKKNITLNTKITADSGISKVWSTIIPPDFTTVLDDNFTTPNLAPYTKELHYNAATKQFEAIWDILSLSSYNGEYKITVYAEDTDGLVYSKSITANGTGEIDYTDVTVEPEPENNTTEPTPLTKVLTINNGWNLVSLPVDTNLSQNDMSTKFPHATIIWKYKEDVWSAYSANANVQDALTSKGVHPITSLSKAEGFWISNDGMEQVSFSGTPYDITTDIKLTSTTQGWKLLGTANTIKAGDLETVNDSIHIIWSYTNNTWNAYSTDEDVQSVIETLTSINTLESIDAGSGFWVNVNE